MVARIDIDGRKRLALILNYSNMDDLFELQKALLYLLKESAYYENENSVIPDVSTALICGLAEQMVTSPQDIIDLTVSKELNEKS